MRVHIFRRNLLSDPLTSMTATPRQFVGTQKPDTEFLLSLSPNRGFCPRGTLNFD